jgi:hypothetical protein
LPICLRGWSIFESSDVFMPWERCYVCVHVELRERNQIRLGVYKWHAMQICTADVCVPLSDNANSGNWSYSGTIMQR